MIRVNMSPRSWVFGTLIATWGALGIWTDFHLGYPALQGVHCAGRCYPRELMHSSALLHRGGALGMFMLVWLWSWPTFLVSSLIYKLLARGGR
jgi:hypothetical protein